MTSRNDEKPDAAGSTKDSAQRLRTESQVSAGGVAFRVGAQGIEVVLIAVRGRGRLRWQLPKGRLDSGESIECAALREVREETGISARLVAPIDKVEYWFVGHNEEGHVRLRKVVHFFLVAYEAGDITDHDHEVEEARWFKLEEAPAMLAFAGERKIAEKASEMLRAIRSSEPRTQPPSP